ncbi:amidohydrolase family protein [Sanguibacter hominis ATCC BAA-789]|uniref:Amidohydrolase family protein n=1 Tax=Sanguibacter hominis ATCC BAA-789 TaxID=1312740 RepID=A0A9X5IRG1_9MICO|nr:amidohydrolase family protein [Sanguibacter hominis]NKX91821.1 amidohydrolase family protein [Sanguibacter hominis ATCC BAA-789]
MTSGRDAVLHLAGPVRLGDDDVRAEAWVVEGRLTFTRPTLPGRDVVRVEGWAVPGLVDVHCHVGLGATGAVSREEAVRQAVTDRDSGVLLQRDAGSPLDTRWVHERDDLPRLVRCGTHVARPKRYLRGYAVELEHVEDLTAQLAREAARGDGWVKVVADWIDRDEGERADLRPLWPDDVLADAFARVHAAGARVTAHTFSHEALPGLLAAGVDCLEHGTGLDDAQVAEVARRGIAVTPTLMQVGRFDSIAASAGRYPVYAEHMRRMHARRYEHVRNLFDAGVRLLVGTDAGGTIPHGLIATECAELARCGIPPLEILAAASWRTRAYLGVAPVAEGAEADVVVYPADPAVDVAVLAAPSAVVLRGRRVA